MMSLSSLAHQYQYQYHPMRAIRTTTHFSSTRSTIMSQRWCLFMMMFLIMTSCSCTAFVHNRGIINALPTKSLKGNVVVVVAAEASSSSSSSSSTSSSSATSTTSNTSNILQKNHHYYYQEINKAAQNGNVELAEQLFDEMYKQYELSKINELRPTTKIFNIILNGWSKKISIMSKSTSKLSKSKSYSKLKSSSSKTKKSKSSSLSTSSSNNNENNDIEIACQRVNDILKRMWDLYSSTDSNSFNTTKPDMITYTTCIDCWAKSKLVNGPEQAELLLNELQTLSGIGKSTSKSKSTTTTVQQQQQQQQQDEQEQQQQAQEEGNKTKKKKKMTTMNRSHQNNNLIPNSRTYNSVMNAYAQRGDTSKVELLLQEMYDEYMVHNDGNVQPNYISYTTLINAYSKSTLKDAPEKAEEVLSRMWKLYKSSSTSSTSEEEDNKDRSTTPTIWNTKPNVISYTTVINCWSKSRDKDGGYRSEVLLREMQRLAKDEDDGKDINLEPNYRTYHAVLDAYARRGNVKAAERILNEMYDEYSSNNGKLSIQPDKRSYNIVLNALSKSTPSTSSRSSLPPTQNKEQEQEGTIMEGPPERAEKILKKMWNLYESGLFQTKPDTISYTCVIETWAKSKRREAPEKVELLLAEMKNKYQEQQQESTSSSSSSLGNDLRPNVRTYSSVMKTWSRHGSPQGLYRILDLLDEMLNLAEIEAKTTMKTKKKKPQQQQRKGKGGEGNYNTITNNDSNTNNHYYYSSYDIVPDVQIYNLILGMIASSGFLTDQVEKIDTILETMEQYNVAPDQYTKFAIGKFGRHTTFKKPKPL